MRSLIVLSGIVAALGLFGCSQNAVTDLTPSFAIPLMGGGQITQADVRGKVVVVDFWATWCPPCIKEIPFYNDLQNMYADKDFMILAVTVQSGTRDGIREFTRSHKVQYTVALGANEHIKEFGGVDQLPTTFLLDRQGRVRKRYIGASSAKQADLKEDIKRLLDGRT